MASDGKLLDTCISMSTPDQEPRLTNLQNLIEPIMQEFKSLKETISTQKSEISQEIGHLQSLITKQKTEIVNEINSEVGKNSEKIEKVIDENSELKKENKDLREQVSKIELSNNN